MKKMIQIFENLHLQKKYNLLKIETYSDLNTNDKLIKIANEEIKEGDVIKE